MEENKFVWDIAKNNRGQLFEITIAQYEHMLNVMPPKFVRGGFAMGEPAAHDPDGKVVFYFATHSGNKCFIVYGNKDEAEKAFRF